MQTQAIEKKPLQQYVMQGRLDYFRACSIFSPLQGAAFHSNNDSSFYYSSGIDFAPCNGIVSGVKELSDKEIENGIDFFETRKLPFIWWTKQNLEPHGLQPGGMFIGMTLEIPEGFIAASDIKIRPLEGFEELNAFSRMVIDAFGMNLNVIGQFQAVYGASMHHNEHLHYLAFYNDQPVGTITLSTSDTTGIWNLSVLPSYRNQGIGTALISTAVEEAKRRGYEQVMVLVPPKMQFGIFSKLGFKKICEFPVFVHETFLHTSNLQTLEENKN